MQLLPHRLFLSRAKLLTLGAFLYGHDPLVDALSPVTSAVFSFEIESTLLDTTGIDLYDQTHVLGLSALADCLALCHRPSVLADRV